jgi:anti-anti-sigma factor
MGIHVDDYNGVCVLTPDGDLSGEVAADARRLCDQHLSVSNAPSFVFDLGRCDTIDSAGLELLCRVRRWCDDAGTRLALARPAPNVIKILQITRLAARFDWHPDLARAVAAAR